MTEQNSVLPLERNDAIATLTLKRPDKLNAIGTTTVNAVHRALDGLSADQSVRAFVFAGAGRAFSAGADIIELVTFNSSREFRALVDRLDQCFGDSTISEAVRRRRHGFAFGTGLNSYSLATGA